MPRPRILGERNLNAIQAEMRKIQQLEEFRAIHEVNRADIGNNGSFLEFGEEAFDCLAEDEQENVAPGLLGEKNSANDVSDEESIGSTLKDDDAILKNIPVVSADSELEEDEATVDEHLLHTISQSSRISQEASNHGEDSFGIDSELETESLKMEFTALSCSTPLPSSPEVGVPVPLISLNADAERISITIGTKALLRVIKWSLIPAVAALTYFSCPYVQYRVGKFITEF